MDRFPRGGLIGKMVHMAGIVRQMAIPVHAANAGYFIVLAVFPALVLILSLLRYTPLDARDLLYFLEGLLPAALLAGAEKLIISTYAHTGPAMVSLSAVGALWSASRGIHALITGLNAIYGVREDRGYWYTRLLSVGYTFAFVLVLVVTLVVYLFGEGLLELLSEGILSRVLGTALDLRFFLLLGVQTGLFTAMFMALPNRRNTFKGSLPGAVLASAGWLIFSELFSRYVEGGYSGIYGSVYALALGLLWLYWCLAIVFYGGALNRLLEGKNM